MDLRKPAAIKRCPHCQRELDGARACEPNVIDAAGSADGPERRRKKTWRGTLYRAAALALLVFGIAVVARIIVAARIAGLSEADPPATLPMSAPHKKPRPPSAPPLSRRIAALENGVVRIESDAPGDLGSVGSGFVIDPVGLIATNYHVLAEATRARARFKDGVAYDIAGYVAVEPENDLAIVQLADPPAGLEVLKFRPQDDPEQLAPVVAWGHPRSGEFAPHDGRVSQVLGTSELSVASRQFLRELLGGEGEQRWIKHTARISEGYSGGPLFNERGEVIGINTWVDQQDHFGYALHAAHIEHLRRGLGNSPAPQPLEKFARPIARAAELIRRLSGERLEALFQQAQAMHWLPADEEAYATLQQLAWAVTFANAPETLLGRARRGGLEDDQLSRLLETADRVVARLNKEKWNTAAHLTVVNDLAAPWIGKPLAGLFFFATVERIVTGENDERGVLLRLAGIEQTVFVPLDGQLFQERPGVQCLVLGVNYEGRLVRYGENPLQLITAPVVVSRTILPFGK